MAVIDADAHVVEWEYMDEIDRAFAPRVMVYNDRRIEMVARRPAHIKNP
jgi:hypothetical protein